MLDFVLLVYSSRNLFNLNLTLKIRKSGAVSGSGEKKAGRSALRQQVLDFATKQAERQLTENTLGSSLLAQISPSPAALIASVYDDLAPHFPDGQSCMLLDMGMGDGRWLRAALDRFPGCAVQAIGIEMEAERIAKTRQLLLSERGSTRGIEIVQADFMHVNVSTANILVAYLSREGNKALAGKLDAELRDSGCLVLAVGFVFNGPEWTAREQKKFVHAGGLKAYLYKM